MHIITTSRSSYSKTKNFCVKCCPQRIFLMDSVFNHFVKTGLKFILVLQSNKMFIKNQLTKFFVGLEALYKLLKFVFIVESVSRKCISQSCCTFITIHVHGRLMFLRFLFVGTKSWNPLHQCISMIMITNVDSPSFACIPTMFLFYFFFKVYNSKQFIQVNLRRHQILFIMFVWYYRILWKKNNKGVLIKLCMHLNYVHELLHSYFLFGLGPSHALFNFIFIFSVTDLI